MVFGQSTTSPGHEQEYSGAESAPEEQYKVAKEQFWTKWQALNGWLTLKISYILIRTISLSFELYDLIS